MSGQEKNKKSVTWDDDPYYLPTFMCVESSMPSPTRVTLSNEKQQKNSDHKQEEEEDDGSPKPMDISGGGVD